MRLDKWLWAARFYKTRALAVDEITLGRVRVGGQPVKPARDVKVGDLFALDVVRITYVVLACAHLDHDPGNSAPRNLAALCQRCHMLHDAEEHRWQRWWNAFRLRALQDLYEDPRHARARERRRG